MHIDEKIVGVVASLGIGAGVYLYRLYNSVGDSPTPPKPSEDSAKYVPGDELMPSDLELQEQKVTYAVLSGLWREGDVKKVQFGKLSEIWREPQAEKEEKPKEPEFLREEITKFYLNRVRGRAYFGGEALAATVDLLLLLDQHGNCASVVRQNDKEPEKNYDGDTYNMLAQVPLYKHSLNVATKAMETVATGSLVPKVVIAALAHVLGKIPFYYGKFYKTSAHPMVAISVVETLPSVKGIKWWDEIAAAIRNHHAQSTEYLDALIREADQAARRFEMTHIETEATSAPAPQPASGSGIVQRLNTETDSIAARFLAEKVREPESTKPATPTETAAPQGRPPAVHAPAPQPALLEAEGHKSTAAAKPQLPMAAAPVEPERSERKRVPRQFKDISAWFEPERFVKELSKIINTTQTGDKFWSALALNGYLYVKPVGFYGVVVRHSKHDPEVVAAGASEQDRDDYLYSVLMELKKQKDLVATEFLGGDRFGAVFTHNPGADGSGTKQFLIPFKAEYFGEEIARAESKRNTLMKKTVALVPAFNKGGN